jgi:hypothetical protein
MALQSPDHLAFQMWLASSKKTRWLRDFCVTQWCFVVLLGEFATDISRAWLLKIHDFQTSKFPNFLSLPASNQQFDSSTQDGAPAGIDPFPRPGRRAALQHHIRGSVELSLGFFAPTHGCLCPCRNRKYLVGDFDRLQTGKRPPWGVAIRIADYEMARIAPAYPWRTDVRIGGHHVKDH